MKRKQPRILNLVVIDSGEPKSIEVRVASYVLHKTVQDPETALRAAIRQFLKSGCEEAVSAVEYANGYFNWGDALTTVPDSIFIEHGLTPLHGESTDIHVNHDEMLCD